MINVLIIEDEHAIRRFLRTALEADGMRVFEAETLQRGLIEAATRKPDLAILDLGLPDGDGIDFIRDCVSGARCRLSSCQRVAKSMTKLPPWMPAR
ncbi:DNA-binding response regulator KdpE [Klebsiella pneumoniae]|uniref:DNA-binding response regulator KdpE n=1 Tax=Klebsiella pneumoniae TaxID=573 RepID=A0A3S4GLJ2_KLEPN|nr:DNA-binding response regulator KdpE [Klebsiella pneumoniae]